MSKGLSVHSPPESLRKSQANSDEQECSVLHTLHPWKSEQVLLRDRLEIQFGQICSTNPGITNRLKLDSPGIIATYYTGTTPRRRGSECESSNDFPFGFFFLNDDNSKGVPSLQYYLT